MCANPGRFGIFKPEPSEIRLLVTSKTSTPLTLPAMDELLHLVVVIEQSVFGISSLAQALLLSVLKMVLLPSRFLQMPSLSQLDLLTRVSAYGTLAVGTSSRDLKVQTDTRIPSTLSPLHQTARTLFQEVWIRLSRCGSLLHQEDSTLAMRPRVDAASRHSKVTRYIISPACS